MPCAIVLVTAAKKLGQTTGSNHILPDGITRSILIRDLAVCVSQLDSMAVTTESNANACGQASRAISRTLDELLNAPVTAAALEPLTATGASSIADDGLQNVDLAMFDDIDLADWIKSIEGTSNTIDWYNF